MDSIKPTKTYNLQVPIPAHWVEALERRAEIGERSLAAEARLALRAHLTDDELSRSRAA